MAQQRKKQGKKQPTSRAKAVTRVKAKATKAVPSKKKAKIAKKPAAKTKKSATGTRKPRAQARTPKPATAKKPRPAAKTALPKKTAARKPPTGAKALSRTSLSRPPAGKVVWHELYTTDVQAARAFYTALFGWTVKDVPMGPGTYGLTFNGPRDVAGIMPGSPGQPSYWLGYIEVRDVDASVEAIEASGGRVFLPLMELPDVGRFAVAADPEGAMFAPISSAPKNLGAKPDGPPAGSFLWDELIVSHSGRAKNFYGKVIGWGTRPMDGRSKGAYDLFTHNGHDCGGLFPKGGTGMPSCWMTYVGVADVDKAAAQAQSLGATIVKPPFDVPGIGRIAILADPTGAALGIYRPAR